MSDAEGRAGDWRVICDYSGFKCWASETVRTWNGFRVLRRFAGSETQRHPQEERDRPHPNEGRVPWARPEATDVFVAAGSTTADDL
jgi:hypothetical protein